MDKASQYAKALKETAPNVPPGSLPLLLQKCRKIMNDRGEAHLYPKVLRETVQLLEREFKTKVVSRYPLETKTKKEVLAFLKKHFDEIEEKAVEFETDAKMLGGVIVSHKDFSFDGTIERQLNKIFQS